MADKPRYPIRRGSVALTRAQWVTAAVALAIALVGGLVLGLAVSVAAAAIVIGLAGLTLAMVLAFGHWPRG
jgi:hypothetical protein